MLLPALSVVPALAPLHPLSRGLRCYYLAGLGVRGGRRWTSLTGQYHGALTTALLPSTALTGWQGPWGQSFGALRWNSAGSVDVPSAMLGSLPTGAVTVAMWFNPHGSLTAYQALCDAGASGTSRQLSMFLGGTASQLYVCVAGEAGRAVTLSQSWVVDTWQHVAMTWDGTTITVYRNGVSVGTAARSSASFSALQWSLGSNPTGGGAALQAHMDGVGVWGRSLTAGEMGLLYRESRQGYPTWPMRVESPYAYQAAAAGGGLVLNPMFGPFRGGFVA